MTEIMRNYSFYEKGVFITQHVRKFYQVPFWQDGG
jgi:hypothetical protein